MCDGVCNGPGRDKLVDIAVHAEPVRTAGSQL